MRNSTEFIMKKIATHRQCCSICWGVIKLLHKVTASRTTIENQRYHHQSTKECSWIHQRSVYSAVKIRFNCNTDATGSYQTHTMTTTYIKPHVANSK